MDKAKDLLRFLKSRRRRTGQNKKAIGIDIGTRAIKVVVLSGTPSDWSIEHFDSKFIELGWVDDQQIKQPVKVADVISGLLTPFLSSVDRVISCVPVSQIISSKITVSSELSEADVALLVESEVESMSLTVNEGLYVEYLRGIDEEASNNGGLDPVHIFISRRSTVDNLVDVANLAKIKLDIVDIDVFGFGRAMHALVDMAPRSPLTTWAVVDCGYRRGRLCVFENEALIHSREIPIGTNIGEDYPESGELIALKRNTANPIEDVGDITAQAKVYGQRLGQEVERALRLFYSSSTSAAVGGIWLVGGGAMIEGADVEVTQVTGVLAKKLTPFSCTKMGTGQNMRLQINPTAKFSLAYGLALRGLG